MTATPSMEDYLERIYELVQEKGYARVVDIAAALEIRSPSVTRMIQKLADESYLVYEKYRGITLTRRGEQVGRSMKGRHKSLDRFLHLLGVADERTVWKDVEGIEHEVSPATMDAIRSLVRFFEENPGVHRRFTAFRKRSGADGHRKGP